MNSGEREPSALYYNYSVTDPMDRRAFLKFALSAAVLSTALTLESCGETIPTAPEAPKIPSLPAFTLPKPQHDLVVFVKNPAAADPVPTDVLLPIFAQTKQLMHALTYGKVPFDFTFLPNWVTASEAYNDQTTNDKLLNTIENNTLKSLGINLAHYTEVVFVSTGGQSFGVTGYDAPTQTSRTNISLNGIYNVSQPSNNGYPAVLIHELIHSISPAARRQKMVHDGEVHPAKLYDYSNGAVILPAFGASVMGGPGEGSNVLPIVSSVDLVALGCITREQVKTIDTSGKTLVELSELQGTRTPGIKVVRIPLYDQASRSFPEFLYLEYRSDRASSNDGGLEIRRWNERLDSPGLQETLEKRVSNDTGPAGLQQVFTINDGDVFRDDPHGVRIKQVRHTDTKAWLEITTPTYK